jgi:hypothetical protein
MWEVISHDKVLLVLVVALILVGSVMVFARVAHKHNKSHLKFLVERRAELELKLGRVHYDARTAVVAQIEVLDMEIAKLERIVWGDGHVA